LASAIGNKDSLSLVVVKGGQPIADGCPSNAGKLLA
jgi:hypothetical protein